jgi:hypothetical protein
MGGSMSVPRLRAPVAGVAVAVLIASAHLAPTISLARLIDSATTNGTLTTTTWSYLHNRPTPPVGNTTAQFALLMDGTVPTAIALPNYDTNCDALAGRVIVRNTGAVTEATVCRYANWQTTVFAGGKTLNGTATLRLYARKATAAGTNPTLSAYLRDFNPVTSTYVTIGSATAAITTDATAPFAQYTFSWSLATSLAAGHQLELKLAAAGGNRDVNLAYDITANPSYLHLP